MGSGQWAVGSGQWAVGSGQWAVGGGRWWQVVAYLQTGSAGGSILHTCEPIILHNSVSLRSISTMDHGHGAVFGGTLSVRRGILNWFKLSSTVNRHIKTIWFHHGHGTRNLANCSTNCSKISHSPKKKNMLANQLIKTHRD